MLLHKPFILTIFIICFLAGNVLAQKAEYIFTSYEVLPESSIELQGSTNINEFGCYTLELVPSISALVLPAQKEKALLLKDSRIKIKVNSLECGKEAINKDLKKTLKEREYPEIVIELKKISFNKENINNILINADLQIAGKNNPAHIQFSGEAEPINDIYCIKGVYDIKLTDFGIEPPQPLFGLIKVHDAFTISFNLIFRHNTDTTGIAEIIASKSD